MFEKRRTESEGTGDRRSLLNNPWVEGLRLNRGSAGSVWLSLECQRYPVKAEPADFMGAHNSVRNSQTQATKVHHCKDHGKMRRLSRETAAGSAFLAYMGCAGQAPSTVSEL